MNGYGNSVFLRTAWEVSGGVPPVNTVAPAITGTAQEGQIVTCSTGTWTGTPTITFAYQWKRNGSNIGSATNSTYTLVTADVSQSITCQVTATNGSGSASATSNTITPIGSFLLDIYSGAAVGYSLRKLRTAYTGNAIRVRRTDLAEQDIAFDSNGDLDTTALLSFVGTGALNNGFITTWYDQSTNANNSTQATALSQAQIVSAGALILDVNTNKITSTWTLDRYSLTSGINTNTQYLSTSMFRRVGTADILVHLGNLSTTVPNPLSWLGTGSGYSVRSRMPSLLAFENVSIIGRCIMTSLRNASNLKVGYRNGTQLTTTATEAPTSQTLDAFGQTTTSYTSGQYQEYIYWNSEQSANRIGIETNINTYWDAY